MKNLFKERLRENLLDAQEWFEIRPDPSWWPFLGIPALLYVLHLVTPQGFLPIMMLAALGAAIVLFSVTVFSAIGLAILRACRDVSDTLRIRRTSGGRATYHRPYR